MAFKLLILKQNEEVLRKALNNSIDLIQKEEILKALKETREKLNQEIKNNERRFN